MFENAHLVSVNRSIKKTVATDLKTVDNEVLDTFPNVLLAYVTNLVFCNQGMSLASLCNYLKSEEVATIIFNQVKDRIYAYIGLASAEQALKSVINTQIQKRVSDTVAEFVLSQLKENQLVSVESDSQINLDQMKAELETYQLSRLLKLLKDTDDDPYSYRHNTEIKTAVAMFYHVFTFI